MSQQPSEQELIRRCREQDVEAFEQLIASYEKKILNVAYRMLGNRHDAEDIAQDVFVKVYRSIGSFKENSSFSTWIYRIATNVCLDELRKRKKRKNDVSINQKSADDEEYELSVTDTSPSPFESAQKKEAMEVLAKAIDCLGEDQKMAVVLRDIEGLSYEEIAAITKSSLGTTKSRINRARLALRKLLEEHKELFL